MCGLVGIISRVAGGLYGYDMDVFEDALVIDTLRGKDSCGAFFGMRNTQVKAIKHGSVPHELFKTRAWNDYRGDAISQGKFIIGHNRAATRGEVSTDNAHPFVEGKIALVHNGTLQNEMALTDKQVVVDSNAVAHALNEGTPEDVLPKIRGAFALIWYNTETKKLYAIRNNERPLFIMTTADRYLLASESWMMAGAWQRRAATSKIEACTEIEVGDLYSWDLDGKMSISKVDLSPKVHGSMGTPPPRVAATNTGPKTTGTTTSAGASTAVTEEENKVVFPKGSTDNTGPTTPEAGILRQAMENVHTKVTPIEKRHLIVCALTRTPAGMAQGTSTPTTESDSTKILTDTNESSLPINDGKILIPTSELSTTSEQKLTVSGRTGLTRIAVPSTEDMELRAMAKNRIENEEVWPTNRRVLVKVLQNLADFRGRTRFLGHLMEPGMEMVTVTGFLPKDTGKGDWVTGATYFTTVSVHGPEVHITNVQPEKLTTCHGFREIPEHLWTLAYLDCECDHCGGKLMPHEKAFSLIKRKSLLNMTKSGIALNVMEVACPDCVEKKITNGEYLELFKARRRNINEAVAHAREKQRRHSERYAPRENSSSLVAVQEGVKGSVGTSSIPGPLTLVPGA